MLSVACGGRKVLKLRKLYPYLPTISDQFDLDVVDTKTVSMTVKYCQLFMHVRENSKQRDLEKYGARRAK